MLIMIEASEYFESEVWCVDLLCQGFLTMLGHEY